MSSRRDPRPTWIEFFTTISEATQTRANCTRRQAAAVIWDDRKRVIGLGYNGAAAGLPGCLSDGACPRGQLSDEELAAYSDYDNGPGLCYATHAEVNAILNSTASTVGATLLTTSSRSDGTPCQGCWRVMAGAGIDRVYWYKEARLHVGYPTKSLAVQGWPY